MDRTRVVIVDDHPIFRHGVRYTLEASGELRWWARPPTGSARSRWPRTNPDVMLVDINLPGLNGLEVARVVRRRLPQTALIILTVYEDDEQLFNAIKVGAAAYSPKDISPEQLLQITRLVAQGPLPDQRECALAALRRLTGAEAIPRACVGGAGGAAWCSRP